MTDARLKGEWLTAPSHDGLSDSAYRVLHNALMHCAEQGSDGAISRRELRFLYPGVLGPEILAEIEAAGFWATTPDGYQLIGWSTTLGQTTAADLMTYRNRNRDRQRKWREAQAKKADESAAQEAQQLELPASQGHMTPSKKESLRSETETRDVTYDVTRYETVHVGQARTGKAHALPALADDLSGPVQEKSHQEPVDKSDIGTGPQPPRTPPRNSPTLGKPVDQNAVRHAVGDHLPTTFDDPALEALSAEILGKAATRVHDPTAYVITTIRSWRQPNMTGADLVDAGEWLERVESIDRDRQHQRELIAMRAGV